MPAGLLRAMFKSHASKVPALVPGIAVLPHELLSGLLKDVSRSFYLTLRVLPGKVRPQIGLAYLLARTSDTIADTSLVPPQQRIESLENFRRRILGQSSAPLALGELARNQGSPAEHILLEQSENSLRILDSLSRQDLDLVRRVLETIISGQLLDLERFGQASSTDLRSLETPEDLDDYTYRVAGCVGEFWTKLCRAHLFSRAQLDDGLLLGNGVRFGKGLQLVNILRDLPADLRQGRCYLPRQLLAGASLRSQDLLRPEAAATVEPLYQSHLRIAQDHLAAGWDYTNMLPFSQFRVRLACAWPILIGQRTIEKLRQTPISESRAPVKVSRQEVKAIMRRTLLYYPFPGLWRKLGQTEAPKLNFKCLW